MAIHMDEEEEKEFYKAFLAQGMSEKDAQRLVKLYKFAIYSTNIFGQIILIFSIFPFVIFAAIIALIITSIFEKVSRNIELSFNSSLLANHDFYIYVYNYLLPVMNAICIIIIFGIIAYLIYHIIFSKFTSLRIIEGIYNNKDLFKQHTEADIDSYSYKKKASISRAIRNWFKKNKLQGQDIESWFKSNSIVTYNMTKSFIIALLVAYACSTLYNVRTYTLLVEDRIIVGNFFYKNIYYWQDVKSVEVICKKGSTTSFEYSVNLDDTKIDIGYYKSNFDDEELFLFFEKFLSNKGIIYNVSESCKNPKS